MPATETTEDHVRLQRDQTHLYFDPNEEPRIRVAPGTRVVVETEDAHLGSVRDDSDVFHSLTDLFEKLGTLGNPVTGPIYVEDVEPGDCIALTLEDIVPGPVKGQGHTCLIPGNGGLVSNYTLQPALTARTLICPIRDRNVLFRTAKGTIEIPTRPFLGTIGIAPAGERRFSYLQGPNFHGNTDVPLNGIGATVVMRANVPGGLISLGDVHAVQGDGEITGTAIECQADVTVLIERIPSEAAQYIALPQVNTSDFIGSIAAFTGVNLGDVVRAGYVDVVKRLVRFYGFELEEAYMLACQTARVTIGQVTDPLYSAAVTIERRYID